MSYTSMYCICRQHDYDYSGESSASLREMSVHCNTLGSITFYGYSYLTDLFILIGY